MSAQSKSKSKPKSKSNNKDRMSLNTNRIYELNKMPVELQQNFGLVVTKQCRVEKLPRILRLVFNKDSLDLKSGQFSFEHCNGIVLSPNTAYFCTKQSKSQKNSTSQLRSNTLTQNNNQNDVNIKDIGHILSLYGVSADQRLTMIQNIIGSLLEITNYPVKKALELKNPFLESACADVKMVLKLEFLPSKLSNPQSLVILQNQTSNNNNNNNNNSNNNSNNKQNIKNKTKSVKSTHANDHFSNVTNRGQNSIINELKSEIESLQRRFEEYKVLHEKTHTSSKAYDASDDLSTSSLQFPRASLKINTKSKFLKTRSTHTETEPASKSSDIDSVRSRKNSIQFPSASISTESIDFQTDITFGKINNLLDKLKYNQINGLYPQTQNIQKARKRLFVTMENDQNIKNISNNSNIGASNTEYKSFESKSKRARNESHLSVTQQFTDSFSIQNTSESSSLNNTANDTTNSKVKHHKKPSLSLKQTLEASMISFENKQKKTMNELNSHLLKFATQIDKFGVLVYKVNKTVLKVEKERKETNKLLQTIDQIYEISAINSKNKEKNVNIEFIENESEFPMRVSTLSKHVFHYFTSNVRNAFHM